MSRYKVKLDQERCIGCRACEIHCKVKNAVPDGMSLNRITQKGPTDLNGLPRIKFKYFLCFHCKKPKCVPACPQGALYVRESDGLVLVRGELCDGCGECVDACPWSVPALDAGVGKIMKCDLCVDRVDAGLDPACVVGCTSKALTFVRM